MTDAYKTLVTSAGAVGVGRESAPAGRALHLGDADGDRVAEGAGAGRKQAAAEEPAGEGRQVGALERRGRPTQGAVLE